MKLVPVRERLPDRRRSVTFDVEHNGIQFRGSVSLFDDGRPGEVFLNCVRSSSTLDHLVSDLAIVASIALQYGAPLPTLRHAIGNGLLGVLLDKVGEVSR
jgi:hypothetical protein